MARALRNKPGFYLLTQLLNSSSPAFLAYRRWLQTIAYEEVRVSTERPYNSTAFVIHGLLGSGRNWRSFSRNLAATLANSSPSSDWRMVLVDQRNHGRSADLEGLYPRHDIVNAAQDLANLVKSQGWAWPDVVMGHSLGGKVALQFAESCARGDYGESAALPKQLFVRSLWAILTRFAQQKLPLDDEFVEYSSSWKIAQKKRFDDDEDNWEQLLVLDSVPGKVNSENSDGEVEKVLETLQNLPSSVPSRKWLVNHMKELGFSKSLADWIGSNLKKSGEHETWAFNLEGAIQMFNSYRETDYWSLLEHPPQGMEITIVRAEKSDRWDPDVIQRLESLADREGNGSQGKVSVHVLPNAGHWVHVDNPKGLLDIVAPKLASLPIKDS